MTRLNVRLFIARVPVTVSNSHRRVQAGLEPNRAGFPARITWARRWHHAETPLPRPAAQDGSMALTNGASVHLLEVACLGAVDSAWSRVATTGRAFDTAWFDSSQGRPIGGSPDASPSVIGHTGPPWWSYSQAVWREAYALPHLLPRGEECRRTRALQASSKCTSQDHVGRPYKAAAILTLPVFTSITTNITLHHTTSWSN